MPKIYIYYLNSCFYLLVKRDNDGKQKHDLSSINGRKATVGNSQQETMQIRF